jgi:hypothetical protein
MWRFGDSIVAKMTRLLIGLLAFAALFLMASRLDQLPGPAGTAIQRNAAHGRGGGVFYTDVDDWLELVRRMEARRQRNVP